MFTIIEGSVDTKATLASLSAVINTDSSHTLEITSPKAGKIIRVIVSSNTQIFSFKIYRHAYMNRTDLVLDSDTSDGVIDFAPSLPYVSPASKLYLFISQASGIPTDFNIHLEIEITKSI